MKKIYKKPVIDFTNCIEECFLLAGTTIVNIAGGGFDPITGEPIEVDGDGGEPSGAKENTLLWGEPFEDEEEDYYGY